MRSLLTLLVVTLGVASLVLADTPVQDNVAPDGFTLLFNGRDCTGWQEDNKPPKNWKVDNGVLEFNGGGRALFTEEKFSNFILLIDWKIPRKGNSGIFLRGGATQVEINDGDPAKPTWNGTSGGLYPHRPPSKHAMKPAGEWNHYEIRVENGLITVFLNGEKTIDAFPMNWEKSTTGAIGFQNHGTPVSFKNIYIKKLPE
jgi:hypothetical protein